MKVQTKDLVPGTKYRVIFDDCCVSGYFIAVFNKSDDYQIQFDSATVDGFGFTIETVE